MSDHPVAKRVLIIHYSQSGDVAGVVDAFAGGLRRGNAEVTGVQLRPRHEYPYPWRSLRRFFDAMPESILGLPPPIEAPELHPAAPHDLVVIAYPVWFLAPAPPVQGFFRTAAAAVLKGADVVTITVSRGMWHNAAERMKALLAAAGACHRDNIVVTHQGSSLATLISTPRALLSGRRDALMGIFPPAGVGDRDLARLRELGRVAATRLPAPGNARRGPLLRGEPAVEIRRWAVVPELLAWYCFRGWAFAIRAAGRIHAGLRALGVHVFAAFLICLILVGLPATVLATALLSPVIGNRLERYVARLAAPTGLPGPTGEREGDPAGPEPGGFSGENA